MRPPLPRRLGTIALAALTLALAEAAPALAGVSVTFDGRVLRYRADVPSTVSVNPQLDRPPPLVVRHSPTPASVGFGCAGPVQGNAEPSEFVLACPLAVPPLQVRYRISLGDGSGSAFVVGLRGVIYAGAGDDFVLVGDRVYGGPGDDDLTGRMAFGGPGDDVLEDRVGGFGDLRRFGGFGVLRGGVGDDRVQSFDGSERLYGGPGNDYLDAEGQRETVVGGPGRDVVDVVQDGAPDVVRLAGGGRDRVVCAGRLGIADRLYVDRRDSIDPNCGDKAAVVTVGRPERLAPPRDGA